jgi:hypothetical protein
MSILTSRTTTSDFAALALFSSVSKTEMLISETALKAGSSPTSIALSQCTVWIFCSLFRVLLWPDYFNKPDNCATLYVDVGFRGMVMLLMIGVVSWQVYWQPYSHELASEGLC